MSGVTHKYPLLCPRPTSSSRHFGYWQNRMLADAYVAADRMLNDFKALGDAALSGPSDERRFIEGYTRGQELLRSIVVVTCSGVEGALKRALRDSLAPLTSSDRVVSERFEAWVIKTISDPEQVQFLAHALASVEPTREALVRGYLHSKVSESLQSKDGIRATVMALGVDDEVRLDDKKGKKTAEALVLAYACRNEIIHEWDWLPGDGLERRHRSVDEVVSHANTLFVLGDTILSAVSRRITKMQAGELPPPVRRNPRRRGDDEPEPAKTGRRRKPSP